MLFTSLQKQPDAMHAHRTLLALAPDSVLVGGAVRDLLLGRPVHDLDYVLMAGALDVARRMADALGAGYYALDERRGVGRVVWRRPGQEDLIIDVALARDDGLDADLRARDFTLNAIALLPDDTLYDPLGGAADLEQRLLRACTDDSLRQDPLRLLRAVRFLFKFHLHPAPELAEQVREAAPGLLRVSPERKRDELLNILRLPEPHFAVMQMRAWGLQQRLFPALRALEDCSQPPPHVYDGYQHTLAALRSMARIDRLAREELEPSGEIENLLAAGLAPLIADLRVYLEQDLVAGRPRWLWLRFAALAHDWGKPATGSIDPDGRIRFIGHETVSARLADAWLEAHRVALAEKAFVHALCSGHMRPLQLTQDEQRPSRRALYRLYRDLGDATPGLLLLHLADYLAVYGHALTPDAFQAHLEIVLDMLAPAFATDEQRLVPQPILNGHDLMATLGLPPGPEIGELLERLREAQALGMISDRESAIALVRRWSQEAKQRD